MDLKLDLDSQHINHANSNLTVTPNYPLFGIEVRCVSKIMRDLSAIYARLINQYKFRYQTVLSARFDKQIEDNQVLDELELFFNQNINFNLTETAINNNDFISPLELQTQQREIKVSGWRFDKINSLIKFFLKLVN